MPKIEANRGDVAEALMGAAVCSKFKNRPTEPVKKSDIDQILDSVLMSTTVHYAAPDIIKNVHSNVTDNISFKLALPGKAIAFLKQTNNRELVKDLYDSVIGYVNSNKQLFEACKNISENNEKNEIQVLSDGTTDQKGTKADIKTKIDGKEVLKQISLKVDGGDQFAQLSGPAWETQLKLFTEHLGLNISSAKYEYEKALEKYDSTAKFADRGAESNQMISYLKDAARVSYKAAGMALASQINSSQFKDKLGKFIRAGATLNDENIELVKLTKGGYKSQSFEKEFEQAINSMRFSYSVSTTGDPKIQINAELAIPTENGKPAKKLTGPLIQIRAKFEAPSVRTKAGKVYGTYMRNYIEAPSNSLIYKI